MSDGFTSAIQDSYGGTNTGSVFLPVIAESIGQATSVAVTSGAATVNFAGFVPLSYEVQRATNVNFSAILGSGSPTVLWVPVLHP